MTRVFLCAVAVAFLSGASGTAQQFSYSSGQYVQPVYEGWSKNPDGTIDLHFGYMNQNWDEELDVPVGPDNSFSPGPADQGQPTHFLPRRNRFIFKLRAPADLGTKEIVWTLTNRGKTFKAYASLQPDYILEKITLISEKGGIGGGAQGSVAALQNEAPHLTVEGPAQRTVKVGQPLALIAAVTDDGLPKPRPPQNFSVGRGENPPPRNSVVNSAVGLRVSWYVYRGKGGVAFDPPQIKIWEDTRVGANSPWSAYWKPPALPADGRILVNATFMAPGEYVLRCLADDGGLWVDSDVKVTVVP
jgi:hypothetical protein